MVALSLESLGCLVGSNSLICFGGYDYITPILFGTFSLQDRANKKYSLYFFEA